MTILSDMLRQNAAESKKADTKNLSPAQQVAYGAGEFAPAIAATSIMPENAAIEGLGTIGKLIGAGLENAVQAVSIYNPADHPNADQIDALKKDAVANFLMGSLVKVGGKVIGDVTKPIVDTTLKPMKYAINMVTDRVNTRLTPDFYGKLLPAMMGVADEGTIQVASKDIADVLSGQKPITDTTREFFANPE